MNKIENERRKNKQYIQPKGSKEIKSINSNNLLNTFSYYLKLGSVVNAIASCVIVIRLRININE